MPEVAPLITIPNHYPAQGALPRISPDQYLGYYDFGCRQLVFVFDRGLWMAKVYLSSQPWGSHLEVHEGRLPRNVAFSGDEARWLYACWQSAVQRFNRSALENVIERALWANQ